ncbi:MAG: hypothetical protein NXH91_16015 [Phyllobacteriaceae bacterium]|nr:hypothetical protein [Phyllobacteriaceae bacterium]
MEPKRQVFSDRYNDVAVHIQLPAEDREAEDYLEEASRQARCAAHMDVEDRVDEWLLAVAEETWDDL